MKPEAQAEQVLPTVEAPAATVWQLRILARQANESVVAVYPAAQAVHVGRTLKAAAAWVVQLGMDK